MTASTRHFIRHYVEMLVAMFAGMGVLFVPALLALGAAGVSSAELRSDAPALMLLGMGITMTVPMVAWMRYRGHGWPASNEMAAAMMIPTAGVIALLGTGAAGFGTLMTIEHVVMLPAMLVAMLLRRDEYTQGALRTPLPSA
jgi:hypothetical protein